MRRRPHRCAGSGFAWAGSMTTCDAREVLRAGTRWRLPLRLRAPQGLRNPGGRDGEKQALAARITATGYVLEPALAESLAPPTGISAWREQGSARIAHAVPASTSRFVRALALGDTRALDDDDWARLRASGLTHLIAISGFHVGLVAGFFAMQAAGSLVVAAWVGSMVAASIRCRFRCCGWCICLCSDDGLRAADACVPQ